MVKGRSRTVRASRTGLPGTALAVALGLTGLTAGCGDGADATPEITTTARPGVAPTPPARGAYFGAWLPPVEAGEEPAGRKSSSPTPTPKSTDKDAGKPGMGLVTSFEQRLGRRLDIVQSYHSWKSEFPDDADKAVLGTDRQLLITWAGTDTKEIVSGRHDTVLRARARAVKAAGKPVFLRWMRDMDTSGQLDKRVHSAADYIAAWKHVRAIFQAERVSNVAWVWCPTAGGFGTRNAPSFYPGDDQVDWVCADAQPGGAYDYRDLSETVNLFLEWARQRPKPIMVAEFGVPQSYGERRAEWLRKAAKVLQNPQVKAVLYFNSAEQAQEPRDRRRNYRVDGDAHAESALREFATNPYFNPRNLPVTSG
ncbi:glycoside hydrolase family 26 protein [Spirillospora sp. CA-253888]